MSRPLFDNCEVTTQANYAWQVLDARAGSLYVELPALFHPAMRFFTPGVRFKRSVLPRVSLYAAAGVGFGVFGFGYSPSRFTVCGAFDFTRRGLPGAPARS